jgi:hypothetical protein
MSAKKSLNAYSYIALALEKYARFFFANAELKIEPGA